jgi:ribosome biogenesis GTPase
MGYSVMPMALKPKGDTDPQTEHKLDAVLAGKTTLVLGPSGSGKSTLINRLIPQAQVLTNAISTALNSGKHTTTSTTLYWVDTARTTAVIDSPGFQEFGLNHIEPMHLASLMPDIKAHASDCKFYNCSHLHEPGCGVINAVQKTSDGYLPPGPGEISTNRYKLYSNLFAELSEKRY